MVICLWEPTWGLILAYLSRLWRLWELILEHLLVCLQHPWGPIQELILVLIQACLLHLLALISEPIWELTFQHLLVLIQVLLLEPTQACPLHPSELIWELIQVYLSVVIQGLIQVPIQVACWQSCNLQLYYTHIIYYQQIKFQYSKTTQLPIQINLRPTKEDKNKIENYFPIIIMNSNSTSFYLNLLISNFQMFYHCYQQLFTFCLIHQLSHLTTILYLHLILLKSINISAYSLLFFTVLSAYILFDRCTSRSCCLRLSVCLIDLLIIGTFISICLSYRMFQQLSQLSKYMQHRRLKLLSSNFEYMMAQYSQIFIVLQYPTAATYISPYCLGKPSWRSPCQWWAVLKKNYFMALTNWMAVDGRNDTGFPDSSVAQKDNLCLLDHINRIQCRICMIFEQGEVINEHYIDFFRGREIKNECHTITILVRLQLDTTHYTSLLQYCAIVVKTYNLIQKQIIFNFIIIIFNNSVFHLSIFKYLLFPIYIYLLFIYLTYQYYNYTCQPFHSIKRIFYQLLFMFNIQHYPCLYLLHKHCLFFARINQLIISMLAENQGMEMECIICLNIEANLPFCMVDCPAGHIYHLKCLENWVRKGNKNCPHDRKEIQLVLCKGRISKLSKCLNDDQRCFLCNQEYKLQQVRLKCLVCKILPCHAKCLKDISVDSIPDFNKYQTCQRCQYQLRQWSFMGQVFLRNLKRLLEDKFYECERQIKELEKSFEKRKKQLQQKQQKILKNIEDLGNLR